MGRTPGAKNIPKPDGGGGSRKLLIRQCNATFNEKRAQPQVKNLPTINGNHKPNVPKLNGASKPSSSNGVGTTPSEPDTTFDIQYEHPYEQRVNGLGSVLEIAKTSNKKVKDILLNECDIIFECRICRNLFRTTSDYLTHKGKYCLGKYQKLSPKALTQLLKLAQDSFSINQSDSLVCPPNSSLLVNGEEEEEKDHEMARPDLNPEVKELSFDINNFVPLLSSGLESVGKTIQLPSTSTGKTAAYDGKELKNLDNRVDQKFGVLSSRRIPPDFSGSGNDTKIHHKPDRTALLGPNGNTVYYGDPVVVQDIVDSLISQIDEKRTEIANLAESLKCQVCQLMCATEKSLRIHVRSHAKSGDELFRNSRRTLMMAETTGPKIKVQEVNEYMKRSSSSPYSQETPPSTSTFHFKKPMPSKFVESSGVKPKVGKLNHSSNNHKDKDPYAENSSSLSPICGRKTNNSFNATFEIPNSSCSNMNSFTSPNSISEVSQVKTTTNLDVSLANANNQFQKDRERKRKLSQPRKVVNETQEPLSLSPTELSYLSPKKISCTKCSNSYSPKDMRNHEIICHGVPQLPSSANTIPNESSTNSKEPVMPKLIKIVDHVDYSNPDLPEPEMPRIPLIDPPIPKPHKKKKKHKKAKDPPVPLSGLPQSSIKPVSFNNNENESSTMMDPQIEDNHPHKRRKLYDKVKHSTHGKGKESSKTTKAAWLGDGRLKIDNSVDQEKSQSNTTTATTSTSTSASTSSSLDLLSWD